MRRSGVRIPEAAQETVSCIVKTAAGTSTTESCAVSPISSSASIRFLHGTVSKNAGTENIFESIHAN